MEGAAQQGTQETDSNILAMAQAQKVCLGDRYLRLCEPALLTMMGNSKPNLEKAASRSPSEDFGACPPN